MEHREDQRDYRQDRIEDAVERDEVATDVEAKREERAINLEQLVKEKERIHKRIGFAQLIAYLFMIAMIIWVYGGFENRDHAICDSAQKNRESTREVVVAIHELGESLVLGSTDPRSPTPEQQASLNKFKKFRNALLEDLAGPVCENP
jgi:hypothetical protein